MASGTVSQQLDWIEAIEAKRAAACRALARDRANRLASFALQDFLKRRQAALRGKRGMAS